MNLRLLALLLFVASQAAATTLQDLRDRGDLRLRSWLTPADNIVVGQEVQLTIEVATQRWFAGGTRIHTPEIANLVILRRDQFANNMNQREGSISWVVQRWNLQLYPKLAGDYALPPIQLELSVNDALDGVIRGSLNTDALAFSAFIPPVLARVERWIATPSLEVSQSLDRQLDQLKPGDAITRNILFTATHLASMMLPTANLDSAEGMPAYPGVPRLNDRSNRGEATAERSESIVYVIEKPGQYLLPEQVFYWWNTDTKSAQTVVLPALKIDAGMATPDRNQPIIDTSFRVANALSDWRLLAAAIAIAGLLYLLWRHLGSQSEAKLLSQASSALRRGDNGQAAQLMYRWLNQYGPRQDWYLLRGASDLLSGEPGRRTIEELLAAAYGSGPGCSAPASLMGRRRTASYWQKLRNYFDHSEPLSLNPGTHPRK